MSKNRSRTSTGEAPATPPEPIATYLHAVTDPDSLKDLDALVEVEERLAEDDLAPAEKLQLLLRRRTLNQVDLRPLEDAFVKAVPEYLSQLGLDIAEVREDFVAVGVRPEVLDRVAPRGRKTKGRTVSVEDVRAYALSRGAPFTQKDLIDATGASRGTVGKVVKSLREEGRLVAHDSRPIMYEVQ